MMEICTCEEDLVCATCICSEPCDVDGFVLCNAERASMGNLVRADTFCADKGEWAAEVTVTRYKRGPGIDAGEEDFQESKIKVDIRSYILGSFLNEGKFDY